MPAGSWLLTQTAETPVPAKFSVYPTLEELMTQNLSYLFFFLLQSGHIAWAALI